MCIFSSFLCAYCEPNKKTHFLKIIFTQIKQTHDANFDSPMIGIDLLEGLSRIHPLWLVNSSTRIKISAEFDMGLVFL